MKQQNYSNHSRFVIGYHIVIAILVVFLFSSSVIHLIKVLNQPGWLYTGLVPVLTMLTIGLIAFYTRVFPLKAQDRVIRAEENFRYYVLTGKNLDSKLTMSQIIALRFAPDDEIEPLAKRAVNESLSSKDIKKAIINWRADEHRM